MTVSWQVHWGGSWCGNYYELLQFKTAILLSLIIKPWALIKSSLIVSKINISVWSKLHISYNKIFEYQMHQKCTWQLKRICDIFRSWFHILQNLVVLVKMSAHFNWIHLALFAVVKFSNEYFDKSFMAVYMYMYVYLPCVSKSYSSVLWLQALAYRVCSCLFWYYFMVCVCLHL